MLSSCRWCLRSASACTGLDPKVSIIGAHLHANRFLSMELFSVLSMERARSWERVRRGACPGTRNVAGCYLAMVFDYHLSIASSFSVSVTNRCPLNFIFDPLRPALPQSRRHAGPVRRVAGLRRRRDFMRLPGIVRGIPATSVAFAFLLVFLICWSTKTTIH